MSLDLMVGFGVVTLTFGFLFWVTLQSAQSNEPGNRTWKILNSFLRYLFLILALIGCLGLIVFGLQSSSGSQVTITNTTYLYLNLTKNVTTCTNSWFDPVSNQCLNFTGGG